MSARTATGKRYHYRKHGIGSGNRCSVSGAFETLKVILGCLEDPFDLWGIPPGTDKSLQKVSKRHASQRVIILDSHDITFITTRRGET